MDTKTNAIRKLTCAAAMQAASTRAVRQARRAYSGDLKHQIDIWLQSTGGALSGAYGSLRSCQCRTRYLYLAKAFIRGVPYRTVEPHTHWDKDREFGLRSKNGFKPNWTLTDGVAQALLYVMTTTEAVEVLQDLGYPPDENVVRERAKLESLRSAGSFVWGKKYRDAVMWSVKRSVNAWLRVGSPSV